MLFFKNLLVSISEHLHIQINKISFSGKSHFFIHDRNLVFDVNKSDNKQLMKHVFIFFLKALHV